MKRLCPPVCGRRTKEASRRLSAPTRARRQRHHAHPRRQNDATHQGTDTSTTTHQGTDTGTTTAAPRAPPPPKRRDAPGHRHEHDDSGTTRTPAAKRTRRATALAGDLTQRRHAHRRRRSTLAQPALRGLRRIWKDEVRPILPPRREQWWRMRKASPSPTRCRFMRLCE